MPDKEQQDSSKPTGSSHKARSSLLSVVFPSQMDKTTIAPASEEEQIRSLEQKLEAGHVFEIKTRYVIGESIGGGGIGTVYRAEKQMEVPGFAGQVSIPQAIKIISPESPLLREKGGRALLEHLLLTEAEINLRLGGNPYTARVEDILPLANGSVGLVFELIRGQTLRELNREHISRGQLVPCDITAFVAHRITSVLLQAHKKGVSHRDLSDGNIMLHETGAVKVLDWGNADGLLGKPGYRAPEDIEDAEAVNRTQDGPAKADVFSLGVLLRQMLVAHNPLGSPTPGQRGTFEQRKGMDLETLVPAHKICQDIPKNFSHIIQVCMQKNPQERPTMEELYHDLLGPYLYSHGFGFTAEALESYLEAFAEKNSAQAPIPNTATGTHLKRIVKWRRMTAATAAAHDQEPITYGEVGRSILDAYGEFPTKTSLEQVIAEEYSKAIRATESAEKRNVLASQCTKQIDNVTHASPTGLKRFLGRDTPGNRRLNRLMFNKLVAAIPQFVPDR